MAVSSRSLGTTGSLVGRVFVCVVISITLLRGKYWRVGFARVGAGILAALGVGGLDDARVAVNRLFTAAISSPDRP